MKSWNFKQRESFTRQVGVLYVTLVAGIFLILVPLGCFALSWSMAISRSEVAADAPAPPSEWKNVLVYRGEVREWKLPLRTEAPLIYCATLAALHISFAVLAAISVRIYKLEASHRASLSERLDNFPTE